MTQTLKKVNWLLLLNVAIMLSVAFILPQFAGAQQARGIGVDCPSGIGVNCNTSGDIYGTIARVIYYVLGFAGLIAVAFLILGGFWYITSAGNAETAGKGKTTVINAIIGLVIIGFSFVIVNIVARQVSTGIGGGAAGGGGQP
ncbi:MAG TPA: hypothetical protein VEA59_00015 [Patescibacteria group bacterium]|nr:hypothetical protein [Patescibacteria group bacterium]